jgi:hypothetical protein
MFCARVCDKVFSKSMPLLLNEGKKTAAAIRGLTHCLTALIFLSLFTGSFCLAVNTQFKSSDAVFCPLQKTWVKKNSPGFGTEKQREPLKNICAPDERKSGFLTELFGAFGLFNIKAAEDQTEKLFFAYYSQGRSAIAAFVSSHNTPGPQFISSGENEKSVRNPGFEIVAANVQKIITAAPPRHSTASPENAFVSSKNFKELKNISRRIQPRAPPFFI